SSVERKRTRSTYPRTGAVRLTGFCFWYKGWFRFPRGGSGKRPSASRRNALIRFVPTSSTNIRSPMMRNERGRWILGRFDNGAVAATQQPGHAAPGQPVVGSFVPSVVHTWPAREPPWQTLVTVQQPGHVAPGQPVVSSVVHTWPAREPALQTLGRCPLHSVGSWPSPPPASIGKLAIRPGVSCSLT